MWSGAAVFPEFGDTGRLGNGVFLTYAGLQKLLPEAQQNVFLVRFRSGIDVQANVSHLRRALDPVPTRDSGRPRELQELEDVTGLPTVLGALLAFLAAATLVHTLLSSVRRRRHELAVFEALGFVRRQVWFTLMWETTTLVSSGVADRPAARRAASGASAWSVFADRSRRGVRTADGVDPAAPDDPGRAARRQSDRDDSRVARDPHASCGGAAS